MNNITLDKFNELDSFIDKMPSKKGALIEVLHNAQSIFGYLPKEVQTHIAEKLNIPVAKVYGTVTFYSYFTMEKRGIYQINVCLGTVCFVKGSNNILKKFEEVLGIKNGQCTKDGYFSLGGLRCVGACGIAPAIMVNNDVYGNFKVEDVKPLLDRLAKEIKEEGI